MHSDFAAHPLRQIPLPLVVCTSPNNSLNNPLLDDRAHAANMGGYRSGTQKFGVTSYLFGPRAFSNFLSECTIQVQPGISDVGHSGTVVFSELLSTVSRGQEVRVPAQRRDHYGLAVTILLSDTGSSRFANCYRKRSDSRK